MFLGLLLVQTSHPSDPARNGLELKVQYPLDWLTGKLVELSKDSGPVNAVINSSSVTSAFPSMAIMVLSSLDHRFKHTSKMGCI